MDENYLDDLLKDLSNDDEPNNSFDKTITEDSGVDLDLSDLDDISLDELDELDDIDLSSLELDDIDFDDVDVTKLEATTSVSGDDEDFDMEALFEGELDNQGTGDAQNADELASGDDSREVFEEALDEQRYDEDLFGMAGEPELSLQEGFDENSGMNNGDSGADMDALADLFGSASGEAVDNPGEYASDTAQESEEAVDATGADVNNMDLDDLFAALGIEDEGDGNGNDNGEDYASGQSELDDLFSSDMEFDFEEGDLSDIEDISEKEEDSKKKKKKSLSVILFGEPDEDDAEEERLLEIKKAKKEEEKAKKQVIKEEKDAKKKEKQALKQKQQSDAKKAKADKKQQRLDEINAEIEAEKDEKKVATPVVIIVYALFALLAVAVILGSSKFNYSQVIRKAADYFERQRYRLAYDEVSGVDVKKKDQELKDRIYTVMYVERLYESYENNMALKRPDKALDALIRGLEKYDVHYEEAVELDIVEDIDICKGKIITALNGTYGISEEEAYELMKLEGKEYSTRLLKLSNIVTDNK